MVWSHFRALSLGLVLGLARGQDYTDTCPEKNGFFADAVQCDRYYECKSGQVSRFRIGRFAFGGVAYCSK